MTLAARIAPRLPPALIATGVALLYPRYEPELRRLADFCPAGGTAVDVGGWYGPWSRRLARRADRVVAIEPVPHLARVLASTTPPHVDVVNAAATDHDGGTAHLWLPPGDRGNRGVSSLVRRDIHSRSIPVPCVRIDSLGLTGVTLIKIDVDGSELDVLRGAEEILVRDRPALFVELEGRIGPVDPVLNRLAHHGYRGWVLPGRDWLPLSDFDLPGQQLLTAHVAEHGLLRRSLSPFRRRYVNSVLFLHGSRRPGGAEAAGRGHRGRTGTDVGPTGPLPAAPGSAMLRGQRPVRVAVPPAQYGGSPMTRPIAVGVDGSPESLAAADWAAREATIRGLPLRIVHAWLWQTIDVPVVQDRDTQTQSANAVVREAETQLAGRYPDLSVSAEVVPDTAVPALLAANEQAEMLVLGSRGHGALVGFMLGSYGQQVIAAATRPVVSVRAHAEDAGEPEGAEIVVGQQGGAEDSDAVLGFAFEAAAVRGATVRAVRAWSLPPVFAYSPGSMYLADEAGGLEPFEKKALEQALAPWRERFPDVPVIEHVEIGSAGEVLLSAASRARLLVVGRRVRRSGIGTRIGSVAHAALHHATCPVAVVPHA